jgi:hypothetical protein
MKNIWEIEKSEGGESLEGKMMEIYEGKDLGSWRKCDGCLGEGLSKLDELEAFVKQVSL